MAQFRYPLPELGARVAVCGVPRATGLIYECETVAAPANLLLRLSVPGWTPLYPLVAFTGRKYGFLADADRDAIWGRWGVPVFEQLLSDGAETIAEECDAHEGLHLCEGAAIDSGYVYFHGASLALEAVSLEERCACGLRTARIGRVRAVSALGRVA